MRRFRLRALEPSGHSLPQANVYAMFQASIGGGHHDQDPQPRFSGDVTAYLKNGRRSEVDFDRRLWTLPPERMKSAKQHVVPLSTAALAVLDRQQRVRTGDAVFPGRSGSPLSYASFATAPAKAGKRPSQKKTPNASVDPERNTRPKQLKGANRCKGVVLHTDGDAAAPPPDLALGLIGKARSVRGSFDFRSFR